MLLLTCKKANVPAKRVLVKLKYLFFISIVCVLTCSSCSKEDGSANGNTNTIQTPPSPVLLSPTNNSENQSTDLLFKWNASEGAQSYSLQVSLSSSFSSYVFNQSGITGTSKQVSGLSNLTKYYWRVNANNSFGNSAYREVWSFTTASYGNIPATPTLTAPANGATGQSITLTISWRYSYSAFYYTLQVSTNSDFSTFVFNQSGLTSTSKVITGLSSSTTYYWRVNASNISGASSFSSPWSFVTGSGGSESSCVGIPTVTYQGKVYNTQQIGTQCWLKENLDVGNMIPRGSLAGNNGIIEKYCYNNDTLNCSTYGGFYKWSEAMGYANSPGVKGICPDGFHIPNYFELQTLAAAVNNNSNDLKATGQGTDPGAGTDASGFSALIGGYYNTDNYFYGIGFDTYFWSSTEIGSSDSYAMYLHGNGAEIDFRYISKNYGFNVRCVKD